MLFLLFLITITNSTVQSYDCQTDSSQVHTSACFINVKCVGGINIYSITESINQDNCIYLQKVARTNYDYYYDDTNSLQYDVNLEIKNIDIQDNGSPLADILTLGERIQIISILDGNLVTVFNEVYELRKLEEITIIRNNLENLKLHKFVNENLRIINVSNNAISQIEPNYNISARESVQKIDLSYNRIKYLPNDCFYSYTKLKVLDLSHNFITKINILSSEGFSQLEVLLVFNNSLTEAGHCFANITTLTKLELGYNNIQNITHYNFKGLSYLKSLSIRSNKVEHVDEDAFSTLTSLQELDLSYNNIPMITNKLFLYNLILDTVLLRNNKIKHIDDNSFINKTIVKFSISNNLLAGTINETIWTGVILTQLNLNGGKLEQVGNRAFSMLGKSLQYLNLSSNSIVNISKTSFHSLELLKKLDLSHNNINYLDFDTTDLKNLSEFYVNNNNIHNILHNSFKNMFLLEKLDLAENEISEIEPDSFNDLKNVEEIILDHNVLKQSFPKYFFKAVHRLRYFSVVDSHYLSLNNESFLGMKSVMLLNSSYGVLTKMEYETFKGLESIETIDLSHNLLDAFHVNTSFLRNLRVLYINNNNLKTITTNTFNNLIKLNLLNLACNKIKFFDPNGLQSLQHLQHFNLSFNNGLEVNMGMFNNLSSLSLVSLENIKALKNYFDPSGQTSIESLFLSRSNILNINMIHLFNVNNIMTLFLKSNKISFLDRESFKNMSTLIVLDLSFNKIESIQPGTFMNTDMIHFLFLQENNLKFVQFGVLDGLTMLHVLNLSSNSIKLFGANLLHSTPMLDRLFLDNNYIDSIKILDFVQNTDLNMLSIGNNSILCDDFIPLTKQSIRNINVTAEVLDFHSENFKGIRCSSSQKQNELFNTSILLPLDEIVKNITKSMMTLLNDNNKHMQDEITNITKNVTEILNIIQTNSNDQWIKLFNISTTILNAQLQLADANKESRNETLESVFVKIKEMIKEVRSSDTLGTSIQNNHLNNHKEWGSPESNVTFYAEPFAVSNVNKNGFNELRILLYVILIFLICLVLLIVIILVYIKVFKKTIFDHNKIMSNIQHDSRYNIMEMD